VSGSGFEVHRLGRDEVTSLQRGMPSWNASEYAKRLVAQERGHMVQVVAWAGERPVGRGMVLFPGHDEWSISAHREGCAEVRDVAVAEPQRRRGVARALMAVLEDATRRAGLVRIGLTVAQDEGAAPARALYERLGYSFAHGPFIASVDLDGDEGPIPAGAVFVYLTKEL
jgi:GNAT superfamily N-acetyltransferase